MSNTKDFKVKAGIQPTSYFEGVGTVVSGQAGYSIGSASYDSKSFSVSAQASTGGRGLALKPDGTKLYVASLSSDAIYQYSLSTAYDISTASYDSVSFSVASQDATPVDLQLNSDGTKFYIVGFSGDTVYQYSMSTAYDLSTASYDSVSLGVSSQDTLPFCITFNSDGTKMYMGGTSNNSIFQYTLSTGFDLSTASYDSVSLDISSQDQGIKGIFLAPSGSTLYMLGNSNDVVFEYTLSTPNDLSTATYSTTNFSVATQSTDVEGFTFNSDGTKMYALSDSAATIYQYSTALNTATLDLSTGSVFEVTPTSDIQVTLSNPADSGTVSGATLLLDQQGYGGYAIENAVYSNVSFDASGTNTSNFYGFTFKSDGTSFYGINYSTSVYYQYDMATAYDISTASYASKSLDMSSQDVNMIGGDFKTDGTKMYAVAGGSNLVYQYTLSTAWDISTASYDSVSFNPTSQAGNPLAILFKSDGTSMYISDHTSTTVYQYTLSTAWDVSTASYASKSLSFTGGLPYHMTFSPNGSLFFLVDGIGDVLRKYDLSTAWDISTATESNSFDPEEIVNNLGGVRFNGDGSKMILVAAENPVTLYQYSTATPATITYDTAIEWPSGTAPTSPAIGETDIITFNTRDGGTSYQAVQAIDGAS